jgi:hypothetical protein
MIISSGVEHFRLDGDSIRRGALESNGEVRAFNRKSVVTKKFVHRRTQIARTRQDSRERIELDRRNLITRVYPSPMVPGNQVLLESNYRIFAMSKSTHFCDIQLDNLGKPKRPTGLWCPH